MAMPPGRWAKSGAEGGDVPGGEAVVDDPVPRQGVQLLGEGGDRWGVGRVWNFAPSWGRTVFIIGPRGVCKHASSEGRWS